MTMDIHNIDLDTAHDSTAEMLEDWYAFNERALTDESIQPVELLAKTTSMTFMLGKVVLALLAERDANRQD